LDSTPTTQENNYLEVS